MADEYTEKFQIKLETLFDGEGIKQAIDGVNKLESKTNDFVGNIKKLNIVGATKNVFRHIMSGEGKVFDKTWEDMGKTKSLFEKLKIFFGGFFQSVKNGIDSTGRKADETVNSARSNLQKAINGFSQLKDKFIEELGVATKNILKESKEALSDFFNFTKDSFLEVGTLADKVFDSILNSFFDMIGKMAAKSITGSIFGGVGGIFGGAFDFIGDLFGFRFGGTIPKTGPYMLHAGEYVLPAEVVDSIRASQRPPLTAASGGLNIGQNLSSLTLKQTVNIQTPANQRNLNIKELAMQIKQASKEGLSWAVDLAKVNYKIGKTGEGQVIL